MIVGLGSIESFGGWAARVQQQLPLLSVLGETTGETSAPRPLIQPTLLGSPLSPALTFKHQKYFIRNIPSAQLYGSVRSRTEILLAFGS